MLLVRGTWWENRSGGRTGKMTKLLLRYAAPRAGDRGFGLVLFDGEEALARGAGALGEAGRRFGGPIDTRLNGRNGILGIWAF